MTQKQNTERRSHNVFLGAVILMLVVVIAVYLYVDSHDRMMKSAILGDMPPAMMDHHMHGDMHMMDGHNMRVNEKGQMYQEYFAQDKKLTPQERQEIIDTVPMPVIGAQYGPCYDGDADAIQPKYYPGTTEYTRADGTVRVERDTCTDDIHLVEYYCTRTIEEPDDYRLGVWNYECPKGCVDGACIF
jgi:hypothetical protein